MEVRAIVSTEVDVCESHGVWLDSGELHAIVERLRQKHKVVAQRTLKDARFSGKVSGWLLGPLSFLFK
jgi:Zn-finger nucleic acid-binding protein